jgi:transposase
MNANLLFTWRRIARTACAAGADMTVTSEPVRSDAMLTASDPGLIPIGVFTHAPDGGPALIAGGAQQLPSPTARVRANVEGRSGLIEIDLADGTRLRVDGFVNERALRHVLSALRATA